MLNDSLPQGNDYLPPASFNFYPPTVVPASPSGVRRVLADTATIHEMLTSVLYASGLTQSEVARRLGIAPQSIDQYRRGLKSNPTIKWLVRYLQVCGGKLVVELPHEPL